MITLKANEEKILFFDFVVEGTKKENMQIKFRLDILGTEYGFPGKVEDDKIQVVLPALNTILKDDVTGIFKGRLRVICDDKIYLKPWDDDVEIKLEPKVVTELAQTTKEDITESNIKVKAYLTSEKPKIVEEKKIEKKVVKHNSILRNKLS
jgi:hypothetical protein